MVRLRPNELSKMDDELERAAFVALSFCLPGALAPVRGINPTVYFIETHRIRIEPCIAAGATLSAPAVIKTNTDPVLSGLV